MRIRLPRSCGAMLVAATLAGLVTATPAHAQLGGLIRRATERRVEQTAEDRVNAATLIAPTFDATTVEITAERLDRYTAAMERLKAARAQNRQRYEALQAQRNALLDSANMVENRRDNAAYEQADRTHDNCARDVRQAMDREAEEKGKAMSARMQANPIGAQNDPQVKAFVQAMQDFAQAQQRGDTAAISRAQQRMMTMFGGTGDSVAVRRNVAAKCGAEPAKPASLVRSEAYRAKASALEKEANALNSTAGGVKGAEVGMGDAAARMMWERIQSWLNGVQENAPITRTFSKNEYDLLVARRSALRRAFSGSE